MSNPKILHRAIRILARWAVWSFFTEIHVIGGENVPKDGPIIVTATHHNMMLDPAVLSVSFPYQRILHYWSKASLFSNPVVSYIMYSSGNIPVDRKNKDRQLLFKGTFEALSKGLAVALFPEGTSYTEPRIMQVKDGAAWAALEYTNWIKGHAVAANPNIVIVPAAIVYTNKSKYRSNVIVEFGRPITMDAYKEQFHSGVEGAPRAAVKRLTRAIENELVQTTINAPDWDTLYAARMARDLMWESDKSSNLDEFVIISQTLVDLFSTTDPTPNFSSVKRHLLEYYSLLQITQLTNSVLSALPLPRTLDPSHPIPLPSRLLTLLILVRDSLLSLARLPFFVFPLIVHSPVYIMGRIGARLAEDEEETQAQNKVVFGLLLLLMIYPAAFFFLWALFMYTPTGALLAAATVYLFALYHNQMINDHYEHAKRFVATWRVLFGVWAPKRWELSMAALSQYKTPLTPNPNPWIDRPKSGTTTIQEPPVQTRPKRRPPPSRLIMRHVLRARAEAVRALAGFFEQLGEEGGGGGGGGRRVRASVHLARAYGGWVDEDDARQGSVAAAAATAAAGEVEGRDAARLDAGPRGWRSATEVIAFLRKRGAKIPTLEGGIAGEWAALSSEGSPVDDNDTTGVERGNNGAVWVSSS